MRISTTRLQKTLLVRRRHEEYPVTQFPDRWRRVSEALLAAAVVFLMLLPFSTRSSAQSSNPVPLLNQPLIPSAVRAGSSGFTLALSGTGFVSGARVYWDFTPLVTSFVSNSKLTAAVPAVYMSNAETVRISVVNPSPGGGKSNIVFFTVTPYGGQGKVARPTSATQKSLSISARAIPAATTPSFKNAAQSPIAVGTAPQSVAAGDFNGDGRLDLAIANAASGTVTVLLGSGAGTFDTVASSPATGLAPSSIAVGDFNGDNRLDLAVTNGGSNNLTVLLGNGNGSFTTAASSPIATGSQPSSVVTGDLNGDGKLDLVVANHADGTLTILLGNGNGTFTPAAASPITVGSGPQSIAVGDFNMDGNLDLAIVNSGSNSLTILLGNRSGAFRPAGSSPATGSDPDAVAVGDFNGDGALDLAVANGDSSSLTILLGNGNGTFRATSSSPATNDGPQALAVGDFNGDAKLDLAVVNSFARTVTILLGNGAGDFSSVASSPATGGSPDAVAVGDFNSDGQLDLVTANSGDNTMSVLLQSMASAAVVSPSSLTFDSQVVGTVSAPQSIGVYSTGSAPLYVSGISASGDFAETSTCPISGARSGCSSGFPSGAVPYSSIYYITAPGYDSSLNATVQMVVGAAPTTVVNFWSLALPSSPGQTFCGLIPLTSSFSAEAYVPTASEHNGDYSSFSVQLTDPTTGQPFPGNMIPPSMLPPGGFFAWPITTNQVSSCSIGATFNPTKTGSSTGAITVTDGTADSPQTVSLTGTGASAAVVSLAPSSLSFGDQVIHTTSAAQTVTLSNTGTGPLSIASISTGSGDFAETNDCPASLQQGGNCTINVKFVPSAKGTTAGALTITDDAAGSPQTVALSGTGTAAAVTLSQNSLSFGDEAVNSTSSPNTLTLSNTGDATLNMSDVIISGDFAISSNTCTGSVAAGKNCAVEVTFKPTVAGVRTGTVSFSDDAAGSPQTVALSGTGTDFSIAPAGGSTDSAAVTAGEKATFDIAIAPSGLTGDVSFSCGVSPTGPTCAVSPSSVNLDGTHPADITVTVATTAPSIAPPVGLAPPGPTPGTLPVVPSKWLWVLALGLATVIVAHGRRRKHGHAALALGLTLLFVTLWAACGTGTTSTTTHSSGTAPGTYSINVTATSGSLSHTTTLDLTVN